MIERAIENNESNNMLLLSRSRQILNSFIGQVELTFSEKQIQGKELKIARVNSILNNSESKIFTKFAECLGLKQALNNNQTVELIEQVSDLFKSRKDLCVVFIIEEFEHYIETSKQIMLYKILDMLTQATIPFVFIGTS